MSGCYKLLNYEHLPLDHVHLRPFSLRLPHLGASGSLSQWNQVPGGSQKRLHAYDSDELR